MASYQVKLHYEDSDNLVGLDAATVGEAVITAAGGKPKPDRVSVKVLIRRPGAESWVACYVAPAILNLL